MDGREHGHAEGWEHEGHVGHHGHRGHRRLVRMAARHHGWKGRGGFGPGFGEWGMPWQFAGRGPRVGRGDVRAAILVLLAESPMHGYQVIQELTERSGGMWRPSPGSVYPTLQLLEDEGLVTSDEADGRRVFRPTPEGSKEAKRRTEEGGAPWEVPASEAPMMELRDIGFQVAAALMQVARAGSATQIGQAKQILTDTRKRLYRLLAEDEPAGSGTPAD